jgi:hypothetical protein
VADKIEGAPASADASADKPVVTSDAPAPKAEEPKAPDAATTEPAKEEPVKTLLSSVEEEKPAPKEGDAKPEGDKGEPKKDGAPAEYKFVLPEKSTLGTEDVDRVTALAGNRLQRIHQAWGG